MSYKDPAAQREYRRRWWQARRDSFFADKACVRCGAREHLELDHVDRGTKVSHRIWSWSQERRDAEIAKCQVLCKECHKAKTREDLGQGGHGTYSCYNRGCRRPECRAAKSAYERERRRKQRERRAAAEADPS